MFVFQDSCVCCQSASSVCVSQRQYLIIVSIGSGGTGCMASSGSLIFQGVDGGGAAGTYTAACGDITSVALTNGGSFYTYLRVMANQKRQLL